MRTYMQQFCPIARASEIFAERWTPIIIRNLLIGCRTFNELVEGAPGIPRSLLTKRLRDLERYGIVARGSAASGRGQEYRLTGAGRELQGVVDVLGAWGARWLDIVPEHLDPGVLLWAIGGCIDGEAMPGPRAVVRIELLDHPRLRFWFLIQGATVELCRKHPGFEEDIVLSARTEWLARWHAGHVSLAAAEKAGEIRLEGPAPLLRAFRKAGGQSPFATITRARSAVAVR